MKENNAPQSSFDFKAFFAKNRTACLAGLGGVLVVALAATGIHMQQRAVTPEESTVATAETTPEVIDIETTPGGIYEKLAASQPVSILVLGDGFAYGDDSWAQLLSTKLGESYNTEVLVDNLALAGSNDIASGYAEIKSLDATADYDLAILSYRNDTLSDAFDPFYEATIRALYERFPGISVLSVKEPIGEAQEGIQSITDHYRGNVLDLAKIMKDHNENPESYLNADTSAFNEEGQTLVADHVLDYMHELVENYKAPDQSNVSILNPAAGALESFAYVPYEDFEQVDDTTYILDATNITDDDDQPVSGILLVDYALVDGKNQFYVAQDMQPFGGLKADYSGPSEERHISLVNDEFHPSESVVIKFATPDQASTFNGIYVAGNVKLPETLDQFETMALPDIDASYFEEDSEDPMFEDDGPSSEDDEFGTEEELEEEFAHTQNPNAGVYAAGEDHPGASNVVVVKHKVVRKEKANDFAPGDETAADGTVIPKMNSADDEEETANNAPAASTPGTSTDMNSDTLPQPALESHEAETEENETQTETTATEETETTPQQTASNGQKLVSGNIYQG